MEGFFLISVESLLLAVCGWRLRWALRMRCAWATFGVWVDRGKHPRLYWTLVAADLMLITVLVGLLTVSVKDLLDLR